MKRVILILAAISLAGAAQAASITNKDAQTHAISVTEDGVKNDLFIEAGETITTCTGGCFLTLPNGDREALGGGESIEIVGGKAVFK